MGTNHGHLWCEKKGAGNRSKDELPRKSGEMLGTAPGEAITRAV